MGHHNYPSVRKRNPYRLRSFKSTKSDVESFQITVPADIGRDYRGAAFVAVRTKTGFAYKQVEEAAT